MSVSDFISLLGGVALFLFGMSIMGDALKKVAGNQLELVLYNLTSTPIKGVLLGTGVTAVIQSSSATSVMVVGFVNSGMMKVNQAIGIVLGAILGTSVTGWVLCLSNLSGGGWVALLSTSTLTALMATIGTLLRMISRKQTTRHVGEILLGFAVLMYGMTAMSGAVEPLRESAVFINAMTSFANPLLGILVGIVFTSVIQSASPPWVSCRRWPPPELSPLKLPSPLLWVLPSALRCRCCCRRWAPTSAASARPSSICSSTCWAW